MTHIRVGQTARVTVDAFPGVVLHGQVDSWSPASGAQFSLLPPDNATGNFTKVVQRIPVKIMLEPDPALGDLLAAGHVGDRHHRYTAPRTPLRERAAAIALSAGHAPEHLPARRRPHPLFPGRSRGATSARSSPLAPSSAYSRCCWARSYRRSTAASRLSASPTFAAPFMPASTRARGSPPPLPSARC